MTQPPEPQPPELAPAPETPLAAALARPAVAAGLFLFLALAMTFPLALRLTSSVPHGAVDLWQNYWNFWWWKKCLLDLGANPNWTDHLFFPAGADLVFYTHSPFHMILALPATALLGPAAAYNLCVIASLWLSGFFAYLFIKDATGDARAAVLGGIVFAFFPQLMEQTLEHLNLFAVEFIPLAMLFYSRLARAGGRWNAAGLALAFALNAYIGLHLAILLALLLAGFAAAGFIRPARPRAAFAADLALAGGLAAVLTLPAVWPMLSRMIGGAHYFQKPQEDKGVDPLFLFLPSDHHPIFGALTFDLYANRRAYRAAGFVCYLGFVPLALAAFALARRPRSPWPWLAVIVAALILALGARPILAGEVIESVRLPFALFAEAPILSLMRVANRFMILAQLGLAVLAAYGWLALRSRTDAKFAALAALVLLEYAWLPYPTQRADLSPYYAAMANSARRGAVIDIPFTPDGRTVMNMVAQTRHERPIAGGYLSTVPPEAKASIEANPALKRLAGYEPRFEGEADRARLLELGFDTVVIHKDRTEAEWERRRAALDPRDLFEQKNLDHHRPIAQAFYASLRAAFAESCGAPVYEDAMIVVFNLDRAPAIPFENPR